MVILGDSPESLLDRNRLARVRLAHAMTSAPVSARPNAV
jgi:hypothetical protein